KAPFVWLACPAPEWMIPSDAKSTSPGAPAPSASRLARHITLRQRRLRDRWAGLGFRLRAAATTAGPWGAIMRTGARSLIIAALAATGVAFAAAAQDSSFTRTTRPAPSARTS